jgi:hypothetical protein
VAIGVFGLCFLLGTLFVGTLVSRRIYVIAQLRTEQCDDEDEEEKPRRAVVRCFHWVFSRRDEWVGATAVDTRRALRMFGLVFDPFTQRAPWFAIVDISVAVLCGVSDALASVLPCRVGQVMTMVIFLIYIILILALRPYATVFDFGMQASIALSQLAAAALAIVGSGDPASKASTAATFLVLYSTIAASALGLAALTEVLGKLILSQIQRQRDKYDRRSRTSAPLLLSSTTIRTLAEDTVASPQAYAPARDALADEGGEYVPHNDTREVAVLEATAPRRLDVDLEALLGTTGIVSEAGPVEDDVLTAFLSRNVPSLSLGNGAPCNSDQHDFLSMRVAGGVAGRRSAIRDGVEAAQTAAEITTMLGGTLRGRVEQPLLDEEVRAQKVEGPQDASPPAATFDFSDL